MTGRTGSADQGFCIFSVGGKQGKGKKETEKDAHREYESMALSIDVDIPRVSHWGNLHK